MASAWNNKQTSGRYARTRDWSWWQVLKRTVAEFRADNVTDWAAALTYYAVLSIFPALIALISVVGLLGSSATNSLLTNLQAFTPGPAKDILTNAVTGLSKNRSAGGIMFVVGLGVALWSASGYVAACGFAKQLFQVNGSRASSKTRGRRQRLTGPTTVAGFYGGRPRYVIHGGAGTLTWPRLSRGAAKIAVWPGWSRLDTAQTRSSAAFLRPTGDRKRGGGGRLARADRSLGRNADRLAHAAAVKELIRQLVDRFGGEDPVEAPPLVPRLDARVPIIC